MNKHVVAIGVLAFAVAFLADKCTKLEKKLAVKTMECECYKFTSKVYEILVEATTETEEKKEA